MSIKRPPSKKNPAKVKIEAMEDKNARKKSSRELFISNDIIDRSRNTSSNSPKSTRTVVPEPKILSILPGFLVEDSFVLEFNPTTGLLTKKIRAPGSIPIRRPPIRVAGTIYGDSESAAFTLGKSHNIRDNIMKYGHALRGSAVSPTLPMEQESSNKDSRPTEVGSNWKNSSDSNSRIAVSTSRTTLRKRNRKAVEKVEGNVQTKAPPSATKKVKKRKFLRPKTAYNFFQLEIHASIWKKVKKKAKNSADRMQHNESVARTIGTKWKALTKKQRRKYQKMADLDKIRCDRENALNEKLDSQEAANSNDTTSKIHADTKGSSSQVCTPNAKETSTDVKKDNRSEDSKKPSEDLKLKRDVPGKSVKRHRKNESIFERPTIPSSLCFSSNSNIFDDDSCSSHDTESFGCRDESLKSAIKRRRSNSEFLLGIEMGGIKADGNGDRLANLYKPLGPETMSSFDPGHWGANMLDAVQTNEGSFAKSWRPDTFIH
mmetsp:Transcript_36229/g.58165  ORF Transcript_36229/g.58165 Transcript_36229/m.58165 type:complete len:488 (-) Transcript_36229:647-2110(-)